MQARLGRSAIVATILATLIVPAVGSVAGPKEKLDETRERLEDVREDIARDEAKAGTLEERIDALNASIRKLQIEVNDLNVEVAEVEGQVEDAEARIEETQSRIDKVEAAATEQAVALYKAGATDTLGALLDAESLAELDDRMAMLGVAAQENTGALVQYGRLKARIRVQSLELFKKKEALTEKLDARSSLLDTQTSKSAELEGLMAELNERLGKKRSREEHFEDEMADIKEELVAHQAKSAVAALGTSNQGFIWPLNGGVTSYYGPRWGRMHTGIDIDGYSGQPIVAAKEGTVALASSYSGYGNAVIVDHGGGYATLYAHLSSFNTSAGASVGQGDIVGYVGCTGSCTGDHLHFEVRVGGNPTDPMPYLP